MKEKRQQPDLPEMSRKQFVKTAGLALGALGLVLAPGQGEAKEAPKVTVEAPKTAAAAQVKQEAQKAAAKTVKKAPVKATVPQAQPHKGKMSGPPRP